MSTQQPLDLLTSSATSELHILTDSVQCPKVSTTTPESEDTPVMSMQHTPDSNISTTSTCFPATDQRRETVDIHTLLKQMSQVEIDSGFATNGYQKLHKMGDTLQGQIYKAQNLTTGQYVAIKKTEKALSDQGIAIQDDTTFCVSENILKERQILKHLTVNNTCIGDHIIHYIDSFEDESSYYLVMEYIESEMNLKQFVTTAHKYIASNKLQRKHYQKTIKYLFWQLVVTIRWMHHDMLCCHLDLCLENIMLKNCSFKEDKDGQMVINPSVSIKLGDFGVSELFERADDCDFLCNKTGLSLENTPYLAPKVYSEEIYDGRKADMWSLGMIIFECLAGEPLYDPVDIWTSMKNTYGEDSDETITNGYFALHNENLKHFLVKQKPLKCFTSDALELTLNLLHIDEDMRFEADKVLQHKWFKMYFKKYHKQIERKTMTQRKRLLRQKNIPIAFYDLI
eukprot:31640_1